MDYDEFKLSNIARLAPLLESSITAYANSFELALKAGWTKESLLSPHPMALVLDKVRVNSLCNTPEKGETLKTLCDCQQWLVHRMMALKSDMDSADYAHIESVLYDVLQKQPGEALGVFRSELSAITAKRDLRAFSNGKPVVFIFDAYDDLISLTINGESTKVTGKTFSEGKRLLLTLWRAPNHSMTKKEYNNRTSPERRRTGKAELKNMVGPAIFDSIFLDGGKGDGKIALSNDIHVQIQ